MDISNFLNVSTNFIDFAVEKISSGGLNWIGKVIQAIIEGVSITGLGIVLFTLALKTLVLPLDIYSRYKAKKTIAFNESYASADGKTAKAVR